MEPTTTTSPPSREALERAAQLLGQRAAQLQEAAHRARSAHTLLTRHLASASDAAPEANAQALRRALGMVRALEREGLVRISEW